jgi:hypothetical protein
MPQMTIEELTKEIHRIYYAEEDLLNSKTQKYFRNKKKEKTKIDYQIELDHDEKSVIEQFKGE